MSGPKPVRESDNASIAGSTKDSQKQVKNSESSKTEVTGKPPIQKADSKQSLQSNVSKVKEEQHQHSKKEDTKVSSKSSSNQQESNKSKSESTKSKQQTPKSSESNKTADSSRGQQQGKSGGDHTKQNSSTNKAGGDGTSSSKPPLGTRQQRDSNDKVQVKSREPSPIASQQQHQKFSYNVVELLEKGKAMT